MINKKLLTFFITIGILISFAVTAVYAETEFPYEITMDYNPYAMRKYTPPKYEVFIFSHEVHNLDYDISCGECHHDKDGNPLENLESGDSVKQCVECHTELKKTKKNRKSIMLLENAIHGSCKVCHKKINIEDGDPKGRKGPGPVSCKDCHVKTAVK
jgi:hypothetical protein